MYGPCCVCTAGPGRARGTRSAHDPPVANSHLCGSTMNESARSRPVNRSRELRQQQRGQSVGAIDVEPGIDLAATSAHPSRSSMTPAFVEPAVATTIPTSRAVTDRRAQGVARQPAVGSGRHDQRLEPEEVQGVVDRGVRGVGDGDQSSAAGTLAADGQRRQVADRSAAHEATSRARGHAGGAAQQIDHLVLGGDRAGAFQPRLCGEAPRRHDGVHPHRRRPTATAG